MPPSETVDIHGFALREIREAKGRKVQDLADSLGCDRSYITHIELGRCKRVSRVFYANLLTELDVRDHRALVIAPATASANAA